MTRTIRHLAESHRWLILLISLAFAVQSAIYVVLGHTWLDEGIYLYASWLTVDQGWVPFRDFEFGFPPVGLYVYGIPQWLFGPSIYVGRIESVIFLALLLVVMYKFAARFGGRKAGVVALLLMVSNVYYMQWYATAVYYGLSLLLVMTSLLVLPSGLRDPTKTLIAVFVMSLAVLTRQNMVVYFALLVVWIVVFNKSLLTRSLTILAALGFPFLILLPFFLLDYQQTIFNVFGFAYMPMGLGPWQSHGPYGIGDYNWLDALLILRNTLRYSFVIFVLFAGFAVVTFLSQKKDELGRLFTSHQVCVLAACMFLASMLFHYFPFFPGRRIYEMYIFYVIPLAIPLVAIAVSKALTRIQPGVAARCGVAVLAVAAVFTPALVPEPAITLHGTPDLAQVQRAARVVAAYIRPDDRVFSIDDPQVLFLAERTGFDPTLNSLMTFFELPDTELLKKYHAYNLQALDEYLSEADAAILSEFTRQTLLTDPRYGKGFQILDVIEQKLEQNFSLVALTPGWVDANEGPIRIYLKKDLAQARGIAQLQ